MTYNIHPLFVHFPIALLILYSFLKIVPFERWFSGIAWKQVRQVLLVFGVLGAFASLSTGEMAEELVRPDRNIVEMHELFANISTWVYVVLLLSEVMSLLNAYVVPKFKNQTLISAFLKLERFLSNRSLGILLAVVGLVSISVTGLLGGVMVYGLSADPFAPIVLNILGL